MPVHTVESIVSLDCISCRGSAKRAFMQLISVISLLSSDTPNTDSPANLDAAVSALGLVLLSWPYTD